MKKSELKKLIQECLVEEGKAPKFYWTLVLVGPRTIGEKSNDKVGDELKYDKSDFHTYDAFAKANKAAKDSNDFKKEERKREAKAMGVKVSQLQKPFLWKVAEVTEGKITKISAAK